MVSGLLVCLFLLALALCLSFAAADTPALFAFGDSLVDAGNNNFLGTSARANHPPYGIDFTNHEATGRFCNGKLVVDLVAEKLGLEFPTAYMYVATGRTNFTGQSINFGSASSGILDTTGPPGVMSFSGQVNAFEDISQRLINLLGDSAGKDYISKSIFFICNGNNDVNNLYLNARLRGTFSSFQNRLIQTVEAELRRLYSLGARKFVVVGLSAVGCIPINLQAHDRRCSNVALNMASSYNGALDALLQSLRNSLPDVQIVKPNFYRLMTRVHDHPQSYGFQTAIYSCCPRNGVSLNCFPGVPYCTNTSAYAFWDGIHQTQRFNELAASAWWSGTTAEISPMNISSLALL